MLINQICNVFLLSSAKMPQLGLLYAYNCSTIGSLKLLVDDIHQPIYFNIHTVHLSQQQPVNTF